MDPDGRVSHETTAESPPLRRRLSMEEDYFYEEVMTLRRPLKPPPYESAIKKPLSAVAKGKAVALEEIVEDEVLPPYSCDIHVEGAFQMKMEIEDATKRAEYRNWNTVFVVLHGTALNIYKCKKDRGWGRSRTHGPNVSPDNPPWMKKTELEKSYSLLHADVGIAADYHKRRYVIRVRAETDQFLLSCVELESFVKWLDALFAAIDVAVPIDDRDFPRDQSIPRIQRLRWFRGQDPTPINAETFPRLTNQLSEQQSEAPPAAATSDQTTSDAPALASPAAVEIPPEAPEPEPEAGPANQATPRRLDVTGRLSTTSYPNEAIDAETGKWCPRHRWTERHDMVYAKLCYSVLLFKSPRKSNYIIMKGKQWFVDWTTGTMRRVFPPGYEDPDYFFGPWQILHAENSRI